MKLGLPRISMHINLKRPFTSTHIIVSRVSSCRTRWNMRHTCGGTFWHLATWRWFDGCCAMGIPHSHVKYKVYEKLWVRYTYSLLAKTCLHASDLSMVYFGRHKQAYEISLVVVNRRSGHRSRFQVGSNSPMKVMLYYWCSTLPGLPGLRSTWY